MPTTGRSASGRARRGRSVPAGRSANGDLPISCRRARRARVEIARPVRPVAIEKGGVVADRRTPCRRAPDERATSAPAAENGIPAASAGSGSAAKCTGPATEASRYRLPRPGAIANELSGRDERRQPPLKRATAGRARPARELPDAAPGVVSGEQPRDRLHLIVGDAFRHFMAQFLYCAILGSQSRQNKSLLSQSVRSDSLERRHEVERQPVLERRRHDLNR